jgi:hypothetical protein
VKRSKATIVTVVSVQAVTKASDTHVPTHFTYALVYSPLVVCMIGDLFNCFIKCLDPSSV